MPADRVEELEDHYKGRQKEVQQLREIGNLMREKGAEQRIIQLQQERRRLQMALSAEQGALAPPESSKLAVDPETNCMSLLTDEDLSLLTFAQKISFNTQTYRYRNQLSNFDGIQVEVEGANNVDLDTAVTAIEAAGHLPSNIGFRFEMKNGREEPIAGYGVEPRIAGFHLYPGQSPEFLKYLSRHELGHALLEHWFNSLPEADRQPVMDAYRTWLDSAETVAMLGPALLAEYSSALQGAKPIEPSQFDKLSFIAYFASFEEIFAELRGLYELSKTEFGKNLTYQQLYDEAIVKFRSDRAAVLKDCGKLYEVLRQNVFERFDQATEAARTSAARSRLQSINDNEDGAPTDDATHPRDSMPQATDSPASKVERPIILDATKTETDEWHKNALGKCDQLYAPDCGIVSGLNCYTTDIAKSKLLLEAVEQTGPEQFRVKLHSRWQIDNDGNTEPVFIDVTLNEIEQINAQMKSSRDREALQGPLFARIIEIALLKHHCQDIPEQYANVGSNKDWWNSDWGRENREKNPADVLVYISNSTWTLSNIAGTESIYSITDPPDFTADHLNSLAQRMGQTVIQYQSGTMGSKEIIGVDGTKIDLIGNHFYSVLAIDPTNRTVTILNPWRGAKPETVSYETFLENLGELSAFPISKENPVSETQQQSQAIAGTREQADTFRQQLQKKSIVPGRWHGADGKLHDDEGNIKDPSKHTIRDISIARSVLIERLSNGLVDETVIGNLKRFTEEDLEKEDGIRNAASIGLRKCLSEEPLRLDDAGAIVDLGLLVERKLEAVYIECIKAGHANTVIEFMVSRRRDLEYAREYVRGLEKKIQEAQEQHSITSDTVDTEKQTDRMETIQPILVSARSFVSEFSQAYPQVSTDGQLNYYLAGSLAAAIVVQADEFRQIDSTKLPQIVLGDPITITAEARASLSTSARRIGDVDVVRVGDYSQLGKGATGPAWTDLSESARSVFKNPEHSYVHIDPVEVMLGHDVVVVNINGADHYVAHPISAFTYKALNIAQSFDNDQKVSTRLADFNSLYNMAITFVSPEELVQRTNQLLILGEPTLGETTFLHAYHSEFVGPMRDFLKR